MVKEKKTVLESPLEEFYIKICLIYHMIRANPRAVSLETIKKVPYEGRTRQSDFTALLETRPDPQIHSS